MKLLSLFLLALSLQASARDSLEKLPPDALRQTSKPAGPVHGIVRNAKGEPLPGASVKIKGSTRGAITNAAGAFDLDVPDGATLVISAVGYKSREVRATANLVIALEELSLIHI